MQACTSLSLPSPPKVQTRRLQRAKVQWRARGSWTPSVRRLPKWKRERSRKPTRLTWVLSFNCRVLTFKFSNFCPTNTYYTVAGHVISCSGIPISPSYPLPLFLLSFLPPSPPLLLPSLPLFLHPFQAKSSSSTSSSKSASTSEGGEGGPAEGGGEEQNQDETTANSEGKILLCWRQVQMTMGSHSQDR